MKRMLKGLIILSLMVGAISTTALASQLVAPPLPRSIHNLAIVCTYRDRQGILWIGTQTGLFRFDGISTTEFTPTSTPNNRISQSYISEIAENNYGHLFAVTIGGLILVQSEEDGRFDEMPVAEVTPGTLVRWLHVANDSSLFIGTNRGLLVHNPLGYVENDKTPTNFWFSGIEDTSAYTTLNDERIVVTNGQKLELIDTKTQTSRELALDRSFFSEGLLFSAIASIDDNRLVLGTDKGEVAIYDLTSEKIVPGSVIYLDSNNRISDFLLIGKKLVTASKATLYTLELVSNGKFSILISNRLPLNSTIYGLHHDADTIWVSTLSGLAKLSKSAFRHYNRSDPSRDFSPTTFGEDGDGNVWVGTPSGLFKSTKGIASSTTESADINHTLTFPPDPRITSLYRDGSLLWMGTESGHLHNLRPNKGSLQLLDTIKVSDSGIVDFLVRSNQQIWVATHRDGLIRIDSEGTSSLMDSKILDEEFIYWVVETQGDGILVSSGNAMFAVNPESGIATRLDFHVGSSEFTSIVLAAKVATSGDIWFGSEDKGLYRWRYEHIKENQLILEKPIDDFEYQHDTIYGIETDEEGNLWLPTQKGIVKTDPEGRFIWRFGPGDGLQGYDFHWGASFTASDGSMYFGGANGYNTFHPRDVVIDRSPPRTILSKIHFPDISYLNFRRDPDDIAVEVTHRDRFVTFEIGVNSPRDSLNTRFRFKLDGFDPDWVNTGQHNLTTYTNLSPGNYVFRAQSANSAGIWDPVGLEIPVTVLPPPWRTWWAYSLYAFGLLLILWMFMRAYQSFVDKRRVAELRVEMALAEELAEEEMEEQLEFQGALLESAYDHKKATLRLISSVLGDSTVDPHAEPDAPLPSGPAKPVEALALLEDCLFYSADGASADLHKYVELLLPRLLKAAPVDPHSIITTNDTPRSLIPAAAASPLAILLYELVENSIQHAFSPDSPANYLSIHLDVGTGSSRGQGRYTLTIADTGRGAKDDLFSRPLYESGAAAVCAIAAAYQGSIELELAHGTTVKVTLFVPT